MKQLAIQKINTQLLNSLQIALCIPGFKPFVDAIPGRHFNVFIT